MPVERPATVWIIINTIYIFVNKYNKKKNKMMGEKMRKNEEIEVKFGLPDTNNFDPNKSA